MARTSKTKIGNSGESNDRMMRAAASGAEAVSRAHEGLLRQQNANAENTQRGAQLAAQVVGAGEERKTQREQFDKTMKFKEKELNLEGAKAGFDFEQGGQQAPQQTAAPQQAPAGGPQVSEGEQEEGGDTRTAQLDQEMQKGTGGKASIGPISPEGQQRLSEQAKRPMEMDPSSGRWVPNAERQREQRRKDFEADTDRIRAEAYHQQTAMAAQKALMKGDKESYEEHAKILANVPNSQQLRYDKFQTGKATEADWNDLSSAVSGIEEFDKGVLAADIKARNFTPAVQAALRAQIGMSAMKSIVGSMGDTSNLKLDWTNPVMIQFQEAVRAEAMQLRMSPGLAAMADIQSTEDKMRFLNVIAAAKVASGMGRAPQGQGSGGMSPSTAAPGAPGAPGEQPPAPLAHSQPHPLHQRGVDAVRQARAGGATPSESLEAGQRAHQTNPRYGPNPSYLETRRAGL